MVGSNERDYCLKLFQLVGWFHDQDVFDQQWTLLVEGRWRLDGDNWEGSPPEKAHTVWVFQQEADRVKLVQYRDSKYADRTADKIMEIYYPYLRNLDKTPDCDPPY